MSLYNQIFGYHPYAALFLKALDVHPNQIPRFRDCFVDGEEVVIYTRTGGSNRAHYEKCDGPSNAKLREVPGFVRDHDDSLDETFAWFRYRIPDQEMHQKIIELSKTCGRPLPDQLHRNFMADMKAGTQTQYTERAKRVFDDISRQMQEKPSGGIIEV